MWTQFRNDGNVPMQYVARTPSNQTVSLPRHFPNSYRNCKYPVANEGCVDVSERRYACTSTEESSRLRASTSLHVKTSLCTLATIRKDGETDGKATYSYVHII